MTTFIIGKWFRAVHLQSQFFEGSPKEEPAHECNWCATSEGNNQRRRLSDWLVRAFKGDIKAKPFEMAWTLLRASEEVFLRKDSWRWLVQGKSRKNQARGVISTLMVAFTETIYLWNFLSSTPPRLPLGFPTGATTSGVKLLKSQLRGSD